MRLIMSDHHPSQLLATPHTFEVLLSTTTVLIHHTDRRMVANTLDSIKKKMVAMKGDKDSVFQPAGT